jgi:ribonuclease-3
MYYDPYNCHNKLIQAADVEAILMRYGFKKPRVGDISLFQQAFVHTSYVAKEVYINVMTGETMQLAPCPAGCVPLQAKSYEEFEFHGDAKLKAAKSCYLERRFPGEAESFLSRIGNRLISNAQNAKFAAAIGLGPFLLISRSNEEREGGRNNMNLLSDSFEAFLFALYRDAGREQRIVDQLFEALVDAHVDIPDMVLNDDNYIDRLQKTCQAKWGEVPTYKEVSRERSAEPQNKQSPHSFVISVHRTSTGEELGRGKGSNAKAARQDAAHNAMLKFHS